MTTLVRLISQSFKFMTKPAPILSNSYLYLRIMNCTFFPPRLIRKMWFAARKTNRDTPCSPSFNTDFSGNIYDRKLSKNFWRGCGCSVVWNIPISSSRSQVLMFPEHCSKYQKREGNQTWTEQLPRWEDMHSWLQCTARNSSCPSSL